MTDHKLELGDTSEAVHTAGEPVLRVPCKVVSEAGLFKNSKQYDKGSTIELDSKTAAAFVAAGDVELIDGEAK